MKGTLIAMLALVLALTIATFFKGDGALSGALKHSATQFLKFLPVLLIAFLLMGFLKALLPEHLVQNWLSDSSGWKGMGIAWIAGALTPGGSIIGMPIAAGLFQAGVGISVLVTYLVSMATLSLLRIPIELGFLGWRLTLVRVSSCLLLPFAAGLLARYIAPFIVNKPN